MRTTLLLINRQGGPALSDDSLPLSEDYAPILEVEDIMVGNSG